MGDPFAPSPAAAAGRASASPSGSSAVTSSTATEGRSSSRGAALRLRRPPASAPLAWSSRSMRVSSARSLLLTWKARARSRREVSSGLASM